MTYLSKPNFVQLSANVATILFVFFIAVQLLVAAGIIPVSILWGGRQTELTLTMRLSSVVATVILGAFIYIIRYRALGVTFCRPQHGYGAGIGQPLYWIVPRCFKDVGRTHHVNLRPQNGISFAKRHLQGRQMDDVRYFILLDYALYRRRIGNIKLHKGDAFQLGGRH